MPTLWKFSHIAQTSGNVIFRIGSEVKSTCGTTFNTNVLFCSSLLIVQSLNLSLSYMDRNPASFNLLEDRHVNPLPVQAIFQYSVLWDCDTWLCSTVSKLIFYTDRTLFWWLSKWNCLITLTTFKTDCPSPTPILFNLCKKDVSGYHINLGWDAMHR